MRAKLRDLLLVGAAVLVVGGAAATYEHVNDASAAVSAIPVARVTVVPPDFKYAAFIGDSYTAGTGASNLSYRWTTLVSRQEAWVENNQAIGGTGYVNGRASAPGDTRNEQYMTQLARVRIMNPAVVVISGGRNDSLYPPGQMAELVRETYQRARHYFPDAEIYAVSPIWGATAPPASLALLQADVRADVEAVGGTYLDIGEPLRGHVNWEISDRVHPNDLGHAAIAAAVERALAGARAQPSPSAS